VFGRYSTTCPSVLALNINECVEPPVVTTIDDDEQSGGAENDDDSKLHLIACLAFSLATNTDTVAVGTKTGQGDKGGGLKDQSHFEP
jgi:hypothetical protein